MQRSANIAALRANLRGQVIQPGDHGYDAARALYNGMIDKRPLVIARCSDVGDVISAVNFGRDNGLLIAIRGGGHSGPGLSSCDGGLVIDLSAMQGVRVAEPRPCRRSVGGTLIRAANPARDETRRSIGP